MMRKTVLSALLAAGLLGAAGGASAAPVLGIGIYLGAPAPVHAAPLHRPPVHAVPFAAHAAPPAVVHAAPRPGVGVHAAPAPHHAAPARYVRRHAEHDTSRHAERERREH